MCEALGSWPVPERAGCVAPRLGEGGFGTVMLVRKKNSGKLFALKMLEKSRMTKRGIADRVISESVSLQQIRHPFVVTLHYAFQDKSRVYFVLEHVAGGDLFNFLQARVQRHAAQPPARLSAARNRRPRPVAAAHAGAVHGRAQR